VLERTAVLVDAQSGAVEARVTLGLPAAGRSILGRWAAELVCDHLPRAVRAALVWQPSLAADAARHVECVEDTAALRAALPALGLVAFVGDGSILPRARCVCVCVCGGHFGAVAVVCWLLLFLCVCVLFVRACAHTHLQ
jgi:predicted ABC-class ATPase